MNVFNRSSLISVANVLRYARIWRRQPKHPIKKEAQALIKINKLLEEAGWRFFLFKASHLSTKKAFLRYIKIDEEMAAKNMMEYWQA